MQRKIILQYYVLSCLFNGAGMQVISAIYVTFLIKNGLNLFEVNLVNAVYFLTLFICEIPTGAFADIFGRKTSFVAACALLSVSMFVYGLSHTFAGFALAEIIAAVGITFRSGAFQAWLVDSLKHYGHPEEYGHIFAREGFIRQIGGGIGAVAGSYMAAYNASLPWFVGGAGMAITTILAAIIMEEKYFVHSSFSWKRGLLSMRDVAVSSIRYGSDHRAVRFILLITGIQIFAVQPLNMYWQPFFRKEGIKEHELGYIFVAMMASLAIGTFIASKLKRKEKGGEKNSILGAQALSGILIIIATLVPVLPLTIIFFVLHEVPRGSWNPMIDGYLHKRIPSSERATIASFCSIAPHIGGAIGLVVSGAIAQYFGISASWIVAGLTLLIGALIVALNSKNE